MKRSSIAGWIGTLAIAAACGADSLGSAKGFCRVGGVTYSTGASVPSSPCESCTCTADGTLACTLNACISPPVRICQIDRTYRYGDSVTGMLDSYSTLAPPSTFAHLTAPPTNAAPVACAPPLPGCDTSAAIDLGDVLADLADSTVGQALAAATPPFFGYDARPVDGSVFMLVRDDGHGFLVGNACNARPDCTDPPAGVAKLVADLRALDTQELADPSCAPLE